MRKYGIILLCAVLLACMGLSANAEGTLTDEELAILCGEFMIPDGIAITYYTYDPNATWYWEGAGRWMVDIALYSGDQCVASGMLDAFTLEPIRQVLTYPDLLAMGEIDQTRLVKDSGGGPSVDVQAGSGALPGVPASPIDKLAFRTGPNTKYVELYTLPQSTAITAYEYEEGNGVTWVLVEYNWEGRIWRAYTGLKRMIVNGNIPWADHICTDVYLVDSADVLAAPNANAGRRGYTLIPGEQVTILEYDGGYAFIEFYDSNASAPSRGYIPASALEGASEDWPWACEY